MSAVPSPSAPLALYISNYAAPEAAHPPAGTFKDKNESELPKLFHKINVGPHGHELELKNRAVVSPMCQYSAVDGHPTPYHLAHLGSFALHGAGTLIVEASGVTSQGRITPQDLGIWKDSQMHAHASLVAAIKSFSPGLKMGIQLAHAGRKASTWSPFHIGPRKERRFVTDEEGGWPSEVVAPSAIPWAEGWATPKELSVEGIKEIEDAFLAAADRAYAAGYDFLELHAAHGYLLHSFLSPISNHRTDAYGGSLENRARLLTDLCRRIKQRFPNRSLWVRVSATDFADPNEFPEGKRWDLDGTLALTPLLVEAGIDVLDVSAGGNFVGQKVKVGPAYQAGFAQAVKRLGFKNLAVGAVGMMEDESGRLANKVLEDKDGGVDLVLLARGFLTNPEWVEEAAVELTGERCGGTPQYHRSHAPKPRAGSSGGVLPHHARA